MKIRHIESVTIDFDEEYISELLVKKIFDEHYDLKYSNFKDRNVDFSIDENGKLHCTVMLDKTKRNDYDKEAEIESTS